MRRLFAILGSAIFLVIAPGTLAVFLPWWISGWRFEYRSPVLEIVGALLILAGALGLLDSFGRFAIEGLGTPAPVFPTKFLVVTGLYRYVRNPMYAAVAALIFGQALFFGNVRLLAYGAMVWVGFHLFVLAYEEPKLRASFGAEYDAYCRAVPRWIPRITHY